MNIARTLMGVVTGAALLLAPSNVAGVSAAPFFILAAVHQTRASPPKKSTSSAKKTSTTKRSSKGKKRPARPRAQKAPTPDRIREIQSALAQKGFYDGEPTGKWDAATVQAMKKFQQANSLNPSGKLDAKSLQKLGLGSDVAGVAAPRPPAGGIKPQPPER